MTQHYVTQEYLKVVDHIEIEHERELAPPPMPLPDLKAMHVRMHAERDDWGHDHKEPGHKAFWQTIDEQIERLRTAKTADEVIAIIGKSPEGVGDAFFQGGGGDHLPNEPLHEAGWRTVWAEAEYYWVMQAPDGSAITYIEGDVYKGDRVRRS